MFVQTWNKYLPVIKILLKRSLTAEQKLSLNKTDFERAAGGKKAKLTFSLSLIKGWIDGKRTAPPPVARDLVTVLQEDATTNKFIREHELEFSLGSSFQLVIRNNTPVKEVVAPAETNAEEAEQEPEE